MAGLPSIPAPSSVAKGSTINIPFTFSNRGTQKESNIRINFYLSKDRRITISDIYLGYGYGFWGNSGFEGTTSLNLKIPTNIATDYYYIGFLLDPNNAIPEVDEDNNGVAYTRSTRIY